MKFGSINSSPKKIPGEIIGLGSRRNSFSNKINLNNN